VRAPTLTYGRRAVSIAQIEDRGLLDSVRLDLQDRYPGRCVPLHGDTMPDLELGGKYWNRSYPTSSGPASRWWLSRWGVWMRFLERGAGFMTG
jgi:hypothetical protein